MAVLALAGCKQSGQPDSEASGAAVDAKPGTAISGGRLVLPAVKGNPGVAYFAIENGSSSTVSVAAVSIDGAVKAEMHQTMGTAMEPVARVDVAAGTTIKFEPGALHVMAYGLDGKVQPGGTVELTVTFTDGDKISAPLKVESRGEAAMGGMDHGGDMDHGSGH